MQLKKGLALWAIANLIVLIAFIPRTYAQYEHGIVYGADGYLTIAEARRLRWVRFPQSYRAMIDLLGYPKYRSATRDTYLIEGSTGYVVIYYSGYSATGWMPFNQFDPYAQQ
jgi:hypothetical protein